MTNVAWCPLSVWALVFIENQRVCDKPLPGAEADRRLPFCKVNHFPPLKHIRELWENRNDFYGGLNIRILIKYEAVAHSMIIRTSTGCYGKPSVVTLAHNKLEQSTQNLGNFCNILIQTSSKWLTTITMRMGMNRWSKRGGEGPIYSTGSGGSALNLSHATQLQAVDWQRFVADLFVVTSETGTR